MSTLRDPGPDGNPNRAEAGRVSAVGVLDRAVSLLELLGDGPAPLRALAERSGLPRPTAHRLLVALEAHGLVARAADGAFRLGPRLTELAVRADPAIELAAVAAPVLARLHAETGESVQLYVRSADRRLCIAARDAGTGLRDSVPVGALLPLEAGSGGKVLLAWSADAARFGVPAAELATVRRRGWADSSAERAAGVASVSAPVLRAPAGPGSPPGAAGLIGALCVSGPVSRLGQSPGRALAPLVQESAAQLAALAAARPS
ncbi:MAG: IclR family transcriptional regulator [Streptosporangiaceae bacterium]